MHQAFSNPDGDGILRLRTWYIHHADQQTNFHSRTVELDEDWRRWENDIIGAWRTHLQAGASVFLHLVAPDPYRGYLTRETHGDIIITQAMIFQEELDSLQSTIMEEKLNRIRMQWHALWRLSSVVFVLLRLQMRDSGAISLKTLHTCVWLATNSI